MMTSGAVWRCKLAQAGIPRQAFPSNYLHATNQPPADALALTPFVPKVLATDLEAGQVPGYLETPQLDSAAAWGMCRSKPDSKTWFHVLTG